MYIYIFICVYIDTHTYQSVRARMRCSSYSIAWSFELFRSYIHTNTLPLSEMTPIHYGQPLYIIKKDLNMVKSKKTSFSCARTRQMCSFKRTHTHHTHKRYLCPKRHTHYRKCPYNIKGDLHIVNAMGWLRVVASLK